MSNYTTYPISESILKNGFEIFYKKNDELNNIYLHHHDFYEIYLYYSGNITYIIDGRKYELRKGDILFIYPKVLHQPILSNENTPYERYVLWVGKKFLKEIFKDHPKPFWNSYKNYPILHLNEHQLNQFTSLFQLLIDEEAHLDVDQDNTITSYHSIIKLIFTLINRYYQKRDHDIKSSSKDLLTRVLEYIDSKLYENINLDDLAKAFYVNKYYLAHRFKEEMHISIYQYCIKKRLILAKNLIHNDVQLSHIYQQCGFSDYSNFYRAFKKEYHVSPKEYKEIAKKLY